MVQDVRSSQGGVKSFDFNSERGVRELLKAIRQSELSQSVRNELRDLVFMYASGGGDTALRNVLEEQIRSYNIVPVVDAAAQSTGIATPVVSAGFSGGRPAPVFRPAVVSASSAPSTPVSPVIAPEPPKVVVPVVSTPIPPVVSTPVVAATPAPVVPEVVQPIPVVAPPAPSPAVEPIMPEFVAPSVPVAPVVSAPVSAAVSPTASTQNSSQFIERIREIKADVNSRVGNPVNLVDINNEVGREYMTSLLEAMKQLNGGDAAVAASAMARLEEVYAEVKKVVDAAATGSLGASAPTPAPAISPVPVTPVAEFKSPVIPEPVKVPVADPVAVEAVLSAYPDADEVAVDAPEPVLARPKIEIRPPVNPPVQTPLPVSVASGDTESVPITSTRFNVAAPVAAATPLRTIEELPTAASLKTTSTGDLLYTKDVDEGLQQLLVEWSLFKKSGLFGTGPNGREHPLFKKIAPLQIPLLLSGRFEGSTQEIKQSITDYMNGWRYEQGIVYEEGESFEVYLRRVIRHIIDWQNKRPRT